MKEYMKYLSIKAEINKEEHKLLKKCSKEGSILINVYQKIWNEYSKVSENNSKILQVYDYLRLGNDNRSFKEYNENSFKEPYK